MRVFNRSVGFDYELHERMECGVVLTGAEVKSVRSGQVKLDGAYVKIMNGEAFLINCHILSYKFAANAGRPDRTRKLLLHKKELLSLEQKMKSGGMALVPVLLYMKGPKVKLEIALARGKKKYEKKQAKKRADIDRDVAIDLRGKNVDF